jgi:hypothetical protein
LLNKICNVIFCLFFTRVEEREGEGEGEEEGEGEGEGKK